MPGTTVAVARTALVLLLGAAQVIGVMTDNCKISWMEASHEVAESNYVLKISVFNTTGDLRSYFPNTNYDITIRSKLANVTFTQFYFAIWNSNRTLSYGGLELRERELSKFHNGPYCVNRIIDGPVSLAKLSLTIGWQSPARDSGCVELRVAVKETELRYHVANATVCQDPRVMLDDPGPVLPECCACDEAKYELAFEGLWSRYTHPKHFPRREWVAVFPTVLGVSHSPGYNFWRSYEPASRGLEKFALTGDTVHLESELKSNKGSIGTLIKFRGANFQNKTRKSFAALRVSSVKHVVSLVARIDPSPDWFVGVHSMELCRPDCTWLGSKVFNLYAFDAGVRNGMLYEDLDGLTEPREVIQRLNMTWPLPVNGIESPFYDRSNNTHDVRPLARIHLRRLRGSERSCQQARPEEDCVGQWGKWGPCSVECGFGISKRSRALGKSYDHTNCSLPLEESRTCQAIKNKCPREVSAEDCALTEWGEWTRCSKMCGQEIVGRSRSYVWRQNDQQCEEQFGEAVLEEKMDCGNPPCPEDNFLCVDDRYNNWMEWSECSLTRGTGFKLRYRTVKEHLKRAHLEVPDADMDYGYSGCLYEKEPCEGLEVPVIDEPASNPDDERSIEAPTDPMFKHADKPGYCMLPANEGSCPGGHNDNSIRYYYDKVKGRCLPFRYSGCAGNENRFNDERLCTQTCVVHGQRIDCEMSKWSSWSACKNCRDFKTREKTIVVQPENGGRMCPLTKVQRQPCRPVLTNCTRFN
ncbi:spondin-1-like isoform X2 [Copidosoma floridanum]|uniref:spondin-1-like isoform X2 n=1 Tax=Copidosoma floridanum TaxID=29053 RepID=UPI0006C998BD|nr:spondin-1-like isoform X2 [Copidosoma floridanum]